MKALGSICAHFAIGVVLISFSLLKAQAADASADPLSEKTLVQKVAMNGIFEIEASKMALDKGASQKIKHLAEAIMRDRLTSDDALKALAASHHIDLHMQMDDSYLKMINDLDQLWGMSFDLAYLEDMDKVHTMDHALFANVASLSSDADLKSFVDKTDATARQHLQMVRDLHSALIK